MTILDEFDVIALVVLLLTVGLSDIVITDFSLSTTIRSKLELWIVTKYLQN